jgi:hypothetical protein
MFKQLFVVSTDALTLPPTLEFSGVGVVAASKDVVDALAPRLSCMAHPIQDSALAAPCCCNVMVFVNP